MSTPHPESESRSKATNAPPVIESVLPLSDDTRLASGTNGPRRVGELLGTVIADLKQKSLRHQEQTNKLHGGVFDQQPDLTWHATEQEWREFNEWAQSRMAVTEAASHGLWLDPETGELTKIEKEQIAEEHPPIVKAAAKVPEDGRNAGDEPLPEDRGDFMAWADKRDRLFREQYPPMPEDYGIEEEPAESGLQEQVPTLDMPVQENTASEQAQADSQTEFATTPEPSFEIRQSLQDGFAGTLFDAVPAQRSEEPATPVQSVQNGPLLTLYDLFGFSAEERSQINRPRRSRKKTPTKTKAINTAKQVIPESAPADWREELLRQRVERESMRPASGQAMERPAPVGGRVQQHAVQATAVKQPRTTPEQTVEKQTKETPAGDRTARKENSVGDEKGEENDPLRPRPFSGPKPEHYREGSWAIDEQNRIGYLKDLKSRHTMFHPLDLSEEQRVKASVYIELRDTYHHLYNVEATTLEAHPSLREMLNNLYDDFKERFGDLNAPENLDLIKMDPGGTEILDAEKYTDGIAHKADIFDYPVAFNPNITKHYDDLHEALAASMNRCADVNVEYIAELTGASEAEVLEQLKGRIYFNPDSNRYEIAERVVSGNVIRKAERVQRFLKDNPSHKGAEDTLAALRGATPEPIAFDDLDFNFGERWIPTGIYDSFASWLFDTEVKVGYLADLDEFSIEAKDQFNIKIQNQYAVRGEFRKYTGLHLMKHALHNTTPNITKTGYDKDGNKIKVNDGEKMQLANTKIDEIRSSFTEWLRDQSKEFKERRQIPTTESSTVTCGQNTTART